ncbi:uncharacterized protein LOC123429109 [Hordeum vulgare subsp. vulgare]|uniref:DUF1618 domain-containing protein n=1 Tax=Hordeum vulgare subsp. vulgare TaxID=112509 RepID=A0A8I7B4H3_HORVV|nr:uncharacterized protein LOC123429109 [Hordeum vulgare subsp. vulgare]
MAAACSWVLVDSKAYIDDDTNGSTAEEFTNTSNHIGVSLWPASPPIPSRLSVHVKWMHPGHEFLHEPKILCAADCVFLLRVAIGSISTRPTYKMSDYFIYQLATSTGPLLKLLPHPYPHLFRDDDVGLLPRDDDFTIAALTQPSYFKFVLYLFKSEDWYWTSREVLVDPPQTPFPEPLPPGRRHFGHVTSSVITIGSRGAIGWVDLWNGILLYDELPDDDNKLRFVPLPVRLESHGGHALECCPKPYRSVSVLGDCLKFVELEPSGDRLPGKDPETGGPNIRVDDWTLTTYTNCDITGDPDDWKTDFTVNASNIRIDTAMRSGLLRCGMLLRKTDNSACEATERNLQNLWTYQPVVSLNGQGTVVYLITSVKVRHPKACLLAVDMANNQVQAMAMIETERSTDLWLNYFPCRISTPAA